MNKKDIALPFIEKAISKTRSGDLFWGSMTGKQNLLKIQDQQDPNSLSIVEVVTIAYDQSYYSKFDDGYIFVLAYSSNLQVSSDLPYMDEAKSISLRVQNSSGPYAQTIADSSQSSDISIQLKRLYNLAEDSALNLEGFINDFLNS